MLSPVGFFLAGACWFCISIVDADERAAPQVGLQEVQRERKNGLGSMFVNAFKAFGKVC